MNTEELLHIEEETISDAYEYAKLHGKRVSNDLEFLISSSPNYAYLYAHNIIKGGWHAIFSNSIYAQVYLKMFPEARIYSKKVPLVLENYAITDVPNTITDEQVIKLFNILRLDRLNNNLVNNLRVYFEPTIKSKIETNQFILISTKDLLYNEEIGIKFIENIGRSPLVSDFV